MRKLFALIAMLALATPAHADVIIRVKFNGRGVESYVTTQSNRTKKMEINKNGEFRTSTIECKSNKFIVTFYSTRYGVKRNNIECVNDVVEFVVFSQS